MNTRKILLGALLGTAAVGAALALAGPANAAVNADGTGNVSKADVQFALHLNNALFDKVATNLVFTGTVNKVQHIATTCADGSTGDYANAWSYPGKTIASTPVYNAGNGKQITGFDLAGAPAVSGVHTPYVATDSCTLVGSQLTGWDYSNMHTDTTVTDVALNGAALPNTPTA